MTTTLSKYLSKSAAMDASWEESKHHRADNGRFTSGSGRGKAKGDGDEDPSRQDNSAGREEMTEDRAEKVIRSAFKDAKQELKALKLVNRAMNAEVLEADEGSCEKVNEYLKKHGLKAKIVDKTTYKIAEDGYDDMQLVDDPMLMVLVLLCAVGLSAKDLHYRAKGRPFYGLHELADVIWHIERASDDLNEVYYMGEKGDVPPDRAFVAAKASEQVGQAGGMDDILVRLTGLVDALAKAVETAKKPGVASGTAAVLDDISKKSLQAKGLLVRTQKDIEKSEANHAAIDKVVGRGIVIGGGETPAQDSGTHEGAVKAAQTRKAHGWAMRHVDNPNFYAQIRHNTFTSKPELIGGFGSHNAEIFSTQQEAEQRCAGINPEHKFKAVEIIPGGRSGQEIYDLLADHNNSARQVEVCKRDLHLEKSRLHPDSAKVAEREKDLERATNRQKKIGEFVNGITEEEWNRYREKPFIQYEYGGK